MVGAAPQRRGLQPETAALLLGDRRQRRARRRARRNRRAPPLGPLGRRRAAPRPPHRRPPLRPARRLAGRGGLRHLLQGPLAGAVRADRHDAHRPGRPRRVVLGARLHRRQARLLPAVLRRRGARHPGQGAGGPAAPAALDRGVPGDHAGPRGAQAAADRHRPADLGRGGARLDRPGRLLRGRGVPAADRLQTERHPVCRSLAPLPALVLLPDRHSGRILPLVVAAADGDCRGMEQIFRRGGPTWPPWVAGRPHRGAPTG